MKLFDVYQINDITITDAKGSLVWDEEGTKYLDMYGGHAVISIGHSHPHWVARIAAQLEKIAFYSNSVNIPLQKELAGKLETASGKKDFQLFLCNSGAEATENALKLASFHTGRKKVISFTKSFHGRTSLAVAATDNSSIVAEVNKTDNVVFLPFNDEEALKHYCSEQGTEIAAIIVEPIQGVGGIRVATETFLQTIRLQCDQIGALFIADEVQCGYGRTGKFFALDHANAEADLYTMAKGMGNGFPIGGVLIAPHIKAKKGLLGTTFGGAHLACAAAIAVLEVMEEEELIKKAVEKGLYLTNGLSQLPQLQNIRGRGLMIGFDVPENLNGLRDYLLFHQHIFTGEAKPNVIRLLPSLAISENELDLFLESLKTAIAELTEASYPVP